MKISIIIPVLNQWSLTKQCLHALERTVSPEIPHEIIVCDGGSTDETVTELQKYSTVRLLRTESTPATFAQNCNYGAKFAKGNFLLFLNNDTIPRPIWLEPMIEIAETQKRVGFVGNVQWNLRRRCWDHYGIVFEKSGHPHHYGQYRRKDLYKEGFGKWNAVTAACCLIRKNLFLEFKGFDESFKNGCEDIDLCLRLRRSGYEHYVSYESRIDHIKCATPGRRDRNKPNLQLFRQRWTESVKTREAQDDQSKVARTLLRKFLKYPWSVSPGQLFSALGSILIPTKSLPK